MIDVTAGEAWARLHAGNDRFVEGRVREGRVEPGRREELASQQWPFAAVLSCGDSRVAPELVFDAGLGDLFDVRNAGQIADDVAIGSLEYAVAELDVPLILVLRHTGCGAIRAALSEDSGGSPFIARLIAQITPSVEHVRASTDRVHANAVGLEHLSRTVDILGSRSELIREAVAGGGLAVLGATYDLATGRVELTGEPPRN